MGDLSHTDFGISHRRRIVTIYRAKVTLAIHQHITQAKILRHTHDGVIHSGITMRMVLTNHIADDTCGFLIWFIVVIT